jgi:class 3 adenylate cyclase
MERRRSFRSWKSSPNNFAKYVFAPEIAMTSENPPAIMQSVAAEDRLLAVVAFTDACDFSRHMHADEPATVAAIARDLALIRSLCAQHQGRFVKSTGDGVLALFPMPAGAIAFALSAQDQLRRVDLPSGSLRLSHRFALHLAEVQFQGDDVLGDGVNIAARLLSEAAPSAICFSQSIYDLLRPPIKGRASSLGPLRLKNIAEPVVGYQLFPEQSAAHLCTQCGYDLRGIGSRVCPECAHPFSPPTSLVDGIPWEHRMQLGALRAYFATIALVCFRTKAFIRRSQHASSLPAAMLFRLISQLVGFISLGVCLIAATPPLLSIISGNSASKQWLIVLTITCYALEPVMIVAGLWVMVRRYRARTAQPTVDHYRAAVLENYAVAGANSCVLLALAGILWAVFTVLYPLSLVALTLPAPCAYLAVLVLHLIPRTRLRQEARRLRRAPDMADKITA